MFLKVILKLRMHKAALTITKAEANMTFLVYGSFLRLAKKLGYIGPEKNISCFLSLFSRQSAHSNQIQIEQKYIILYNTKTTKTSTSKYKGNSCIKTNHLLNHFVFTILYNSINTVCTN